MNSMERRLGRIEKKHPVTTTRADVVAFASPGAAPVFAWVWTADGYESVSRDDRETKEAFQERCNGLVGR
jgi:hypothetical protein